MGTAGDSVSKRQKANDSQPFNQLNERIIHLEQKEVYLIQKTQSYRTEQLKSLLPGFAAGLKAAGYNLKMSCGVWPSCLVSSSVNERLNLSEQKCINLSERYSASP